MGKIKFIAFEGVAGAGKSTQIENVRNYLDSRGKSCFVTKAFEDDRRRNTEAFFNTLQYTNDNAKTFIFQALHCVQYQEVIENYNRFDYILADRWRDTFFAYHKFFGELSTLEPAILDVFDHLAFRDLYADLTFFFDISPEVAQKRYKQREDGRGDMIKTDDIAFFETTINFYRNLTKEKKWIRIDCNGTVEYVTAQIIKEMERIERDI
ncbi:dTMP kinase [Dyadobacter helix]|nr:dTMP kinase [Dyadobacter sp. CECT 9275]